MSDLLPISLEAQIACIERELDMRAKVYPRLVAKKQMAAPKADYEISAMTAVLKTLRTVQQQIEEDR